MTKGFKIIQLSDLHLSTNIDAVLLGVPTYKSLECVVELLGKESQPDLIILSGDISQDGSEASYRHAVNVFKKINLPIYYAIGNHDNVSVISKLFPVANFSNHKHLLLKNWQIILLNSQVKNEVYGSLADSELIYLKHCLETYPEHHAMIVFHHPPIFLNCAWLDKIGLQNAEAFWSVVEKFPQVNTVLFGHLHYAHESYYNKIQCLGAPATCFQFNVNSDIFCLDELNPGYRWLEIYPDGRSITGISRLNTYVGRFEKEAKGY